MKHFKKMKHFISDISKHGIKYAIGMFLIAHDNDILYDYCYALDFAPSQEEEEYECEPVEPTACGCTMFTDCTECSSYAYCHHLM